MVQRTLTILVVLNAIASVAMSIWTLFLVRFAGLLMWDTNGEAFKFALNKEQRESILWRQDSTLQGAVYPLLITNVVWIILTVAFFCCREKAVAAETSAEPKPRGS